MKKLIIGAVLTGSLFFSTVVHAQNALTTLVRNGETTPYYGVNSFVEAYNASENGDFLYLSPGFYNAPSAIAKSITVIGAGHFPDSAGVAKRTTITGGLQINKGSNNLHLEGFYINDNINYQGDASIDYVKVIRCRFGDVLFNSASADAAKNNCSFEKCFFGSINFNYSGDNLLIRNSVIQSIIRNILRNALIENNVLFVDGIFSYVYSSTIRNNVILRYYGSIFH